MYLGATRRREYSQRRQSSRCNAIRQARRQLGIAHKGEGRKTAERVWERSLKGRRLEMEGGEVERGERRGQRPSGDRRVADNAERLECGESADLGGDGCGNSWGDKLTLERQVSMSEARKQE